MKITQCPPDNQRSKDWLVERLGTFSGSEIHNLLVKGRSKDEPFGQTAKDYIYEKMSERELRSSTIGLDDMWNKYRELTGIYCNKAMQFGTENEEDAIEAVEVIVLRENNGYSVIRTGSIPHATIPNFSASPDACIVDENDEIVGIVETKVPLPKTFIKYRSEMCDGYTLKNVMPAYYYQMQAEMMVTGAKYGLFAAYQPFLINPLHTFLVERDEVECELIAERLKLAEEFITKAKKDGNCSF